MHRGARRAIVHGVAKELDTTEQLTHTHTYIYIYIHVCIYTHTNKDTHILKMSEVVYECLLLCFVVVYS